MTVDTNAPERIWVHSTGGGNGGLYSTRDQSDTRPSIPYIRLDLHEAAVRKAREDALEEAAAIATSRADAWVDDEDTEDYASPAKVIALDIIALTEHTDERRIREALE